MSPAEAAERAHVVATVRAYATALDRRDFELLRAVVTDPVLIDFRSYDPDRTAVSLRSTTWIEGLRPQLVGLDATLHTIRDPRITIDGDGATCVAAVRADHVLVEQPGAGVFTLHGHYTDTLVRVDGAWLITAKVLAVTAEEGPRSLMASARARGLAHLGR